MGEVSESVRKSSKIRSESRSGTVIGRKKDTRPECGRIRSLRENEGKGNRNARMKKSVASESEDSKEISNTGISTSIPPSMSPTGRVIKEDERSRKKKNSRNVSGGIYIYH